MSHPSELRLHFDNGAAIPVRIRRATMERSAHSGRDLVELHGWSTAEDEHAHERVTGLLRECVELPVSASDPAGEFAGKWNVSWNSYGESQGVHTYTLLLREAEELSLEALRIEELELHPYEYREEVVGRGLTIRAKVMGGEAEIERLRALVGARRELSVVRSGISEEPRRMRLAVAEWSQAEDRIKYRLVLVDHDLDAEGRAELARIEEEKSRAALGFYANLFERFATLMVSKGLLTREELRTLREQARDAPGIPTHEMWRVPDVDEV